MQYPTCSMLINFYGIPITCICQHPRKNKAVYCRHFQGLYGHLPAGHQQKPVERQTWSSQVWSRISVGLLPFSVSSSIYQKGVSFKQEFHTLLAMWLLSAAASSPFTNCSSFLPNLGVCSFFFPDFFFFFFNPLRLFHPKGFQKKSQYPEASCWSGKCS